MELSALAEVYFKTFTMGWEGEQERSEGEGEKLIKQIINSLFIGFNEGWRPFCLKSQQGQDGSGMEMALVAPPPALTPPQTYF